MNSQMHNLEYKSVPINAPTRPRIQIFSVAGLVCGIIISINIFAISIFIDRFENIFTDFHLALPALTQTIIDLSSCIRSLYWIPLLLVPVVTAVIGGLMQPRLLLNPFPKHGSHRIVVLTVLFLLLMNGLVVISLFMPMITLLQGMTGGSKH